MNQFSEAFREGEEEIASQPLRVFRKVLARRYNKSGRPSRLKKSSDSGYSSAPSSKRSSFPISDHDILEESRPEEDCLEEDYSGKKKLTGFLALDANTIEQECSHMGMSSRDDQWRPYMYPEAENSAEFLNSKVERVSRLLPSEEDTMDMGLSHNKASHSHEDVSEGVKRAANPFDDDFARENSPCEAGQTTSVRLSPEPPQSESTLYTSTPPSENDESPSTNSDDDMTDNEGGETSEPETSFSFRSSSNSLWPLNQVIGESETLTNPLLDEARRYVVDYLVLEVRILLDRQIGIRSRTSSAQTSPADSQSNQAGGSTEGSIGNSNSNQKRVKDSNGLELPGDDSDDSGPAKRQKTNLSRVEYPSRMLACPYYKRNPQLYQKNGSCTGPGWINCHRLKQHLYRRHRRPVSCPRCCTVFLNEMEIHYHLRQPETCSIKRKIQVEGFDKRQEEHLHSRKRFTGTEEQRWKEIFRILFPDDDEGSIPSPYYEVQSAILSEYHRYEIRELPRLIRDQLDALVCGSLTSLEGEVQSRIPEIVRKCQKGFLDAYAAGRHPSVSEIDERPDSPTRHTAPTEAQPEESPEDIDEAPPIPILSDNDVLYTDENGVQEFLQSLSDPCNPFQYPGSEYRS